MKLKIVFIIGQLSIGGSETYLINLATGLNKNKFEIEVVCLSDKLDLKQTLIDQGCGFFGAFANKSHARFRPIVRTSSSFSET